MNFTYLLEFPTKEGILRGKNPHKSWEWCGPSNVGKHGNNLLCPISVLSSWSCSVRTVHWMSLVSADFRNSVESLVASAHLVNIKHELWMLLDVLKGQYNTELQSPRDSWREMKTTVKPGKLGSFHGSRQSSPRPPSNQQKVHDMEGLSTHLYCLIAVMNLSYFKNYNLYRVCSTGSSSVFHSNIETVKFHLLYQ